MSETESEKLERLTGRRMAVQRELWNIDSQIQAIKRRRRDELLHRLMAADEKTATSPSLSPTPETEGR